MLTREMLELAVLLIKRNSETRPDLMVCSPAFIVEALCTYFDYDAIQVYDYMAQTGHYEQTTQY